MIKIESIKGEASTMLHFESSSFSSEALAEMDYLFQILKVSTARTALGGGFVSSNKFFLELKNPS